MTIKMIAAVAACTTVVGGGVTTTAVMNSPKIVTANAISRMFEDVLAREEIEPIYNMLKGGSLEAQVSEVMLKGANKMKGTYAGKVYFSEDALMLEDVMVQYGNFKIDADLYVSQDTIYLSEQEVLGGEYGINMDTLAKDFEESIFAYGSGSKYAIPDEDIYETLLEAFEDATTSKKATKDAKKILKKYLKKATKIINKNVEYSSEGDKVKLNGEKKNVRVITVEMDEEALSNIIYEFYEFLVEDKSLVKHFEKYETQYATFVEGLEGDYDSMAEWYEDILDDAEDTIEDLCEEIENSRSFQDWEFILYTPKAEAKVLGMELNIGKTNIFALDFGTKGVKNTDEITLEVGGEKISYEIKKNDKKTYKATLEVEGTKIMSINVDRSDDTFDVRVGDYKVTGTMENRGKQIYIAVEKYAYAPNGVAVNEYTTDLEILITEKDKMPSIPKDFNTIADIEEADMDKVLNKISDLINNNGYYN